MIILIDAFGILIILSLGLQGYKDSQTLSRSYLTPCLISFVLFYQIFGPVYNLFLRFIPSTFISGIITTLSVNLILILAMHKLIMITVSKVEEKFFLPNLSPFIKKIIGVIVGALTGYIFITGTISALEKHSRNILLRESIFYNISHKPEKIDTSISKIDNLPALKKLYSEESVIRFNFTEEELIAVLKMIRAIPNNEAQSLLKQMQTQNVQTVYQSLITFYTSLQPDSIPSKYFVEPEMINIIKSKFSSQPIDVTENTTSDVAPIDSKAENGKSISDIIDSI